MHIDALIASGRHDEARAAIVRAYERALARADLLIDPAWRERYLTNVPENARIVALAGAH